MNSIQVCPQNAPWQGYNRINIYHYSALSSIIFAPDVTSICSAISSMLQIDQMAAGLLGLPVSSLALCTNSSTNQPTKHNIRQFQLFMPDTYSDLLWSSWSGDQIPVEATFCAPVQTGPATHMASYTMGAGSFLVGGSKAAGTWHWPSTPF
jgi:hypothetical protein